HWGWIVFVLFTWLLWIIHWWLISEDRQPDITVLILLAITTILCFYALFWIRITLWIIVRSQSAADKAKMASVHTLSLTPEALLYSWEDSRDRRVWSGIERIAVTDDHVFFFIMSQAGHAVPRRAFASNEAFREFAETAQRYKKEAEEQARSRPPATGIRAPKWPSERVEQYRSVNQSDQLRSGEPRPPNELR